MIGRDFTLLGYVGWQCKVMDVARKLHAREHFDVAHHVTLGADWLPAGIAGVPSLPFVWGPLGGTTGTVPRLWRHLGWRSASSEALRSVALAMGRRLTGQPTARRAQLILAQNHDVARRLGRFGRLVTEPHIALSDGHRPGRLESSRTGQRRALFVGRLVGWKGPRLAVKALAEPDAAGWTLDLIGAGPDSAACTALIERLALGDRVQIRGPLPREVVLQEFRTADCLLLPSLHDSAGWVVAEALAIGVPVVCFDRGGPGFLVGPGQGEKVSTRGDVVANLAAALRHLSLRFPPQQQWNADRLPGLLDGWYHSVAEPRPTVAP